MGYNKDQDCLIQTYIPDLYYREEKKKIPQNPNQNKPKHNNTPNKTKHKGNNVKNYNFCFAKNPKNVEGLDVLHTVSTLSLSLITTPVKTFLCWERKVQLSGSEVRILFHLGGLLRLQPDHMPVCLQSPLSTEITVRVGKHENCELQRKDIVVSSGI